MCRTTKINYRWELVLQNVVDDVNLQKINLKMNRLKFVVAAVALLWGGNTIFGGATKEGFQSEIINTNSPNGQLSVASAGTNGLVVSYKKDNITIPLLVLLCGDVRAVGDEKQERVGYWMQTGKRRWCTNEYVEQSYRLSGGDTLTMRVYNDGVAWRKSGVSKIEFVAPQHCWLSEWSEAYEGFFPKDPPMEGKRFGYPALLEYSDGIFALLSESGITPGGAGTSMYYVSREGRAGNPEFELRPDGQEDGGWQTLIAGSLSDVVESTLINDNSAPCIIADSSWVEPGVASWVYWAYNHGSNDFNIISKYVDMAEELKLPYVLIDAEWDEMKDGKTVEDAVAYAVEKGVKPMIWYNSSIGWVNGAPGPKFRLNTPEDLEKEFAWCEEIGVKGVKVDFFCGDVNRNFRLMKDILEAGARHKLLVNFHGATVPRGWQRTYPNFITNEGVYGAEWYNNVPTFTDKAAAHNATLPFTRNVVASMDYTPCAFSDSQHPHITTKAHELALTALYESGIQHLADRPEVFLAQPQPVKDYLSELPTVWDETLLLDGYPGEYVIMARRSGNRWWISGINGSDDARKGVKLDLLRLNLTSPKGKLFEDSKNDDNDGWAITTINNAKDLPSTVDLQPRGGFVMVISAD